VEAGVKLDLDRVRWNSAIYHYHYNNLQVQVTNKATGAAMVENAAKATLYGLESDLSVALIDQLRLTSGIGLQHSKFETYDASTLVPSPAGGYANQNVDLSGKPLPTAPQFSGYLGLNYTFDLRSDWGSLSFNVLESYTSRYSFDATEIKQQHAYGLLSGSLAWIDRSKRYSVRLAGNNLTNKEYYGSRAIESIGAYYQAAEPRTWKLTLTAKY
jgi:iron complex outermembrane recepter protein